MSSLNPLNFLSKAPPLLLVGGLLLAGPKLLQQFQHKPSSSATAATQKLDGRDRTLAIDMANVGQTPGGKSDLLTVLDEPRRSGFVTWDTAGNPIEWKIAKPGTDGEVRMTATQGGREIVTLTDARIVDLLLNSTGTLPGVDIAIYPGKFALLAKTDEELDANVRALGLTADAAEAMLGAYVPYDPNARLNVDYQAAAPSAAPSAAPAPDTSGTSTGPANAPAGSAAVGPAVPLEGGMDILVTRIHDLVADYWNVKVDANGKPLNSKDQPTVDAWNNFRDTLGKENLPRSIDRYLESYLRTPTQNNRAHSRLDSDNPISNGAINRFLNDELHKKDVDFNKISAALDAADTAGAAAPAKAVPVLTGAPRTEAGAQMATPNAANSTAGRAAPVAATPDVDPTLPFQQIETGLRNLAKQSPDLAELMREMIENNKPILGLGYVMQQQETSVNRRPNVRDFAAADKIWKGLGHEINQSVSDPITHESLQDLVRNGQQWNQVLGISASTVNAPSAPAPL